jgi:hypothetical protein
LKPVNDQFWRKWNSRPLMEKYNNEAIVNADIKEFQENKFILIR